MELVLVPRYSYSDYVQWSDEWELIGGHPYSLLPSPKFRHGKVLSRAVIQAGSSLAQHHDCNCLVLFEQDWKISSDTVVRPDMMIICGEPETDVVEFPPVLIMEVLLPATRAKDRNIKSEIYRQQGVRYYLMADYEKKSMEILELAEGAYRVMETPVFQLEPGLELSLDIAALWR